MTFDTLKDFVRTTVRTLHGRARRGGVLRKRKVYGWYTLNRAANSYYYVVSRAAGSRGSSDA